MLPKFMTGCEALVVCQERILKSFCPLVLQKAKSFPTDNRKRKITETNKMVDKSVVRTLID